MSFINAKFPCIKFITYSIFFQDIVSNMMEILDINRRLGIIFIL